jgi:hypothetical protein
VLADAGPAAIASTVSEPTTTRRGMRSFTMSLGSMNGFAD